MLLISEKLPTRRRAPAHSEPNAASGTARTVALLVLAAILVAGQMYSVLALYRPMATSFGVAPHQTIWTSTAFGFAYAIGFLGSGPLTDRYGSRRMIIAGLTATAATTALVASAPNVAVAILLRVMQGLTASLFAPAAFAYIAVHVDARRRAIALSSVTSSMLAAAIIMQVGAQVMADLWTWQSVFLVCAPLLAAAALLAAKLLKSGPQRPAAPFRDAFRPIPKLIGSARTALLYLATMTLLGSFVAVYTALALAGPESVTGSSATLLGVRASALPAMIVGPLVASRLARISASRRVVGGLTAALDIAASGQRCGHRPLTRRVRHRSRDHCTRTR